jgi:hypothetical protein
MLIAPTGQPYSASLLDSIKFSGISFFIGTDLPSYPY